MILKQFLRRVIWFFLYYGWLKHYFKFNTTTSLLGFSFTIFPSVFHPKFSFSSKIFATFISQLDLKYKTVLDMGTGSGIIGIVSASKEAMVTAIDINENAINCAKENASRNKVEKNISFNVGNLFSPISHSTKFDYIFFNPPFYPREVFTVAQHAWNAGENFYTIQRFASESNKYLNENGKIFFIISSDVDTEKICSFFHKNNFNTNLVFAKKLLFEEFFIYEVHL